MVLLFLVRARRTSVYRLPVAAFEQKAACACGACDKPISCLSAEQQLYEMRDRKGDFDLDLLSVRTSPGPRRSIAARKFATRVSEQEGSLAEHEQSTKHFDPQAEDVNRQSGVM